MLDRKCSDYRVYKKGILEIYMLSLELKYNYKCLDMGIGSDVTNFTVINN